MKNKIIQTKSIGIIGGMGPQASARLIQIMVDMVSKDFGIREDDDFPEFIMNSVPVPDFISNKKNLEIAQKILKSRVRALENFNPICFGIVCNTAHIILNDLQEGTKIPFISIIEEVSRAVVESGIEKIGLLGTPVTIKSSLYQKELNRQNVEVVIPSAKQQKITEEVIRNVLAGKNLNSDKLKLLLIVESLKKKGAQGIILGCTELPLIFPKEFSHTIFDSIEILARALLRRYYK